MVCLELLFVGKLTRQQLRYSAFTNTPGTKHQYAYPFATKRSEHFRRDLAKRPAVFPCEVPNR